MIRIEERLLLNIVSCMNDLYVTPRLSWSFCDFRKNEALTPRFWGKRLTGLSASFYRTKICLSTIVNLKMQGFSVNRAQPNNFDTTRWHSRHMRHAGLRCPESLRVSLLCNFVCVSNSGCLINEAIASQPRLSWSFCDFWKNEALTSRFWGKRLTGITTASFFRKSYHT